MGVIPLSFRIVTVNIENLQRWFIEHQRDLPFRKTTDPYWIWISEILLQQTQMETAIPYFLSFIKRFPNVHTLAEAREDDILKTVQGIGYYRRFRFIKKAAQVIVQRYGGQFPKDHDDILELPGIGSYTAGAISSIAFNHPRSAVDGNVIRVLARQLGFEKDLTQAKHRKQIETYNQELVERSTPRIYTQAIMELGALICTPKQPRCSECPIAGTCHAFKKGMVDRLPVLKKKGEKSIEHWTAIILVQQAKIGLVRREESLLQGTMALPQYLDTSIEALHKSFNEQGLKLSLLGKVSEVRHVFTHKQWRIHPYVLKVESGTLKDIQFYTANDIKKLPISRAHLKVLEKARSFLPFRVL